jgi:hypothetical protein
VRFAVPGGTSIAMILKSTLIFPPPPNPFGPEEPIIHDVMATESEATAAADTSAYQGAPDGK